MRPLTEGSVRRRVLGYLGRYSASRVRLEGFVSRLLERSRRRGVEVLVDDSYCAGLIAECVARGFVDDRAFAVGRLRRWYRGGRSLQAMEAGLRSEGLDADVIAGAFGDFYEELGDGSAELVEYATARQYAMKRGLGRWRGSGWRAYRDRDLGRLGRRGFSYEVACRVLGDDPSEGH